MLGASEKLCSDAMNYRLSEGLADLLHVLNYDSLVSLGLLIDPFLDF